ncbi:MAG: hypothetical protein HY291_16495 [Planctomycetes bacterium]|nr:hypothetical protein [Planctomycetota bacterium]
MNESTPITCPHCHVPHLAEAYRRNDGKDVYFRCPGCDQDLLPVFDAQLELCRGWTLALGTLLLDPGYMPDSLFFLPFFIALGIFLFASHRPVAGFTPVVSRPQRFSLLSFLGWALAISGVLGLLFARSAWPLTVAGAAIMTYRTIKWKRATAGKD